MGELLLSGVFYEDNQVTFNLKENKKKKFVIADSG